MNGRFRDKVVLITGAGGGIGRVTAVEFAREAATVVLADIHEAASVETAKLIEEGGATASCIKADVTRNDEIEALVARIVADHGRLDIAFNNAGIESTPVRTADTSEAEFDRLMAVNLKGVFLCMKAELRQMLAQGGGAIVNTASVAGLSGVHSMPAYAATKHGVIGLTRSAALEYVRKGIRVNAVCPSVIRTAMVDRALQAMPAMADKLSANNPTRRLGEPIEVARAVLWLCSDEASYINGVALPIDGGFTAQ